MSKIQFQTYLGFSVNHKKIDKKAHNKKSLMEKHTWKCRENQLNWSQRQKMRRVKKEWGTRQGERAPAAAKAPLLRSALLPLCSAWALDALCWLDWEHREGMLGHHLLKKDD